MEKITKYVTTEIEGKNYNIFGKGKKEPSACGDKVSSKEGL